jgi:hypothetical protein
MAQDVLRELDDRDKANEFIAKALVSNTTEIDKARVASQLYLAYRTRAAGESLAASLADHARALQASAAAAGKQAAGLNLATWVLVAVTIVLAVVQGYAMFRGCR